MTKSIELHGKTGIGKYAIVDDEDYDWLNNHLWFLDEKGYAVRRRKEYEMRENPSAPRKCRMHREVNNTPKGKITDHINGNRLDNRKCNLRTCDERQNASNTKKRIDGVTSKYKGVHLDGNRYVVSIVKNTNEGVSAIGRFTNEEAAANCYNYWAKIYYGEFANLNDVKHMEMEEWEKFLCKRVVKSSKFKGVTYNKKHAKWYATISNNKRGIYLGSFETEIDAVKKYNNEVIELFGENSLKLNRDEYGIIIL